MKNITVNKLLFFVRIILILSFSIGTSQVNIEEAFPNLNFIQPVDLQYSPDGSDRLFVVEQEGWGYWVEVEEVVLMEVVGMEALYNPLRLPQILQSEEETVMPNSTVRIRPKLTDVYCTMCSHNILS